MAKGSIHVQSAEESIKQANLIVKNLSNDAWEEFKQLLLLDKLKY
jgi:hypothetical protein